jgi:hypothetical protein
MTIHTTLRGAGFTPRTFEAKRAEKAKSRRRLFLYPDTPKPIKIGTSNFITWKFYPPSRFREV